MSVILDKKNNIDTYSLAVECFGEEEFFNEFYEKQINKMTVAAKYIDNRIVSMAMCKNMLFSYNDYTELTSYICMVCTLPKFRHMGFMDENINLILNSINTETVFLVPVNQSIYSHLGFVHSWIFNESEREILYADDDLIKCYGKQILGDRFLVPERIIEI